MIFEAAYIFCIEVWARMFVENFVGESDFCRWGGFLSRFLSTDRISVECRYLDISIDNLFCHRIIIGVTGLYRNVFVFEGGYVIRSRLYKTENKVLMSEVFKGPFSKDIISSPSSERNIKCSVLRSQCWNTNRNIKKLVYCRYRKRSLTFWT